MAAARNACTGAEAVGMPASLVAYTKLSGGTTIRGGVVSTTLTSKLAEVEFPWESLAVQVTFVVPSGKVFPEAGAQATGTGPSTSSMAVGGT